MYGLSSSDPVLIIKPQAGREQESICTVRVWLSPQYVWQRIGIRLEKLLVAAGFKLPFLVVLVVNTIRIMAAETAVVSIVLYEYWDSGTESSSLVIDQHPEGALTGGLFFAYAAAAIIVILE